MTDINNMYFNYIREYATMAIEKMLGLEHKKQEGNPPKKQEDWVG
jgi:hypothetical protein